MPITFGEENLGDLAKGELKAAREDPRASRDRGAMVADFWDAVEAAERGRTFAILGLHELACAVENAERRLGVSSKDTNLTDRDKREIQACWARAEIARAEIANDHPQQNAQALISLNSALDAMVEEWVASLREIQARWHSEQLFELAAQEARGAEKYFTPESREKFIEAGAPIVATKLPKISRLRGSGMRRYERALEKVELGAPKDREIPADLDQALCEVGALRDILIHRAGRVDAAALSQAPSLRHRDGDLVRITGDDYRLYSAAIRCYAEEIIYRVVRNWKTASDGAHGPELANWRHYYKIGA